MIKQALVFVLILWTGVANLATATQPTGCADMAQKGCQHVCAKGTKGSCPCCHSSKTCRCSVEERSNEQAAPMSVVVPSADRTAVMPLDRSGVAAATALGFEVSTGVSPPLALPLYQLFSVYRI